MPQARWEQFEIKAGNSSMRDLKRYSMLNSDFEFKNLIQFKKRSLASMNYIYSTYTVVIYVLLSCGIGNLIHDQKRLQAHVARRKCRFLRRCRCWHLLYIYIYQVDVIDVMKNMNSNLPQQNSYGVGSRYHQKIVDTVQSWIDLSHQTLGSQHHTAHGHEISIYFRTWQRNKKRSPMTNLFHGTHSLCHPVFDVL